jgi:hypothetical protein
MVILNLVNEVLPSREIGGLRDGSFKANETKDNLRNFQYDAELIHF